MRRAEAGEDEAGEAREEGSMETGRAAGGPEGRSITLWGRRRAIAAGAVPAGGGGARRWLKEAALTNASGVSGDAGAWAGAGRDAEDDTEPVEEKETLESWCRKGAARADDDKVDDEGGEGAVGARVRDGTA